MSFGKLFLTAYQKRENKNLDITLVRIITITNFVSMGILVCCLGFWKLYF